MQGAGGRSMTSNNMFYRPITPYCSNRMLDLCFSMPSRLKRRGLVLRQALALCAPELSQVPAGTGLPPRPWGLCDLPILVRCYSTYLTACAGRLVSKSLHIGVNADRDIALQALVRTKLRAICRTALNPGNMASASLYRPDRLAAFARQCETDGPPMTDQTGLMLSMELTFRYLGSRLLAS